MRILSQAEVERTKAAMAYLDRCGATFEAVPSHPTWFAARWEEPESFDEPRRWACCIEEWDQEFRYALAFKARVEAGARS